jgi:hypothetical protein
VGRPNDTRLPESFFLFLVDEFVDLTTASGSSARGNE